MAHAAPKVVVIGLGYVGLPLAFEAVLAGLECVGFDNSPDVTDRINSGHSHVDDVADTAVQRMLDFAPPPTQRFCLMGTSLRSVFLHRFLLREDLICQLLKRQRA